MTVTKRDGSVAPLEIKKIRKQTQEACEGLENVDYNELELDAKIQFRDKISTEEIQQTLIKTAVDKIDIDRPNWTFVAARLFLNDIYHKVGKLYHGKKGNPYSHTLYDYLKYGVENQIIHPKLLDESKFNHKELNNYIKPERDKQFTYLGIKMLYDRYLQKDEKGNLFELPQHLFMSVAMWLASNEKDPTYWAKRFYDRISTFQVMVATPTLSNARLNRHQLSSCYQGVMNDNIEDIFDCYKEMALLSKYGGGIGWDVTNIRALGSMIDNKKGASGGLIPWLKITNDIAISVDQLGVRKGAIAIYNEPWHLDILDFLELKKNSGEERRRAHDIFPALWIPDLFMKRVENNEKWTLFDPHDVPDLHKLYGEEFEKRYVEYENDSTIRKEVIDAKELWKKILREYYETGNPFLTFKDEFNRRNQNKHVGIINASNLCTEIGQVTHEAEYSIRVEFNDGSFIFLEQEQDVEVIFNNKVYIKKAKRLTSEDILKDFSDKRIIFTERFKTKDRRTLVCNLASINLSKVNTKEQIEDLMPDLVRMLDNVIDLNYYPTRSTRETNVKSRAIGIGMMGEAQMLAEKQIMFGSQQHLDLIDNLYETISYNAIKASAELAKEKGSYPEFEGSSWSKGELIIDHQNEKAKELTNVDRVYEWEPLRELVKQGIRNGYLMAIAPTSSISLITGTTPTIEPVYKRKWYEENMSGLIPVVVPNLSPDTYMFYVTSYELDQKLLVKAAAVRQKWIDQAQSLNIFIRPDKASGRYLNEIYMLGWKLGVKSFYYLRSQSPEENKDDVVDRSFECVGCQ